MLIKYKYDTRHDLKYKNIKDLVCFTNNGAIKLVIICEINVATAAPVIPFIGINI